MVSLLYAAAGVGLAAAVASFSVGHMLVLEKWTDYLYFDKKILKRRTALGRMTSERRVLAENWGDTFCLILAPAIVLAHVLIANVLEHGLDFSIRPLDLVLGTISIYVCFDLNYFFVHRMLHDNPYLYKNIHKRHHTDMPVHIFLATKANYLENIMAISPIISAWVATAVYMFSRPSSNVWSILLPALTLVMEFNTAHTGYQDHFLLYVMSPLQWFVKMLPYARWATQDHEEHHLKLKKNYAPIFTILDRWNGSLGVPDVSKFQTVDFFEKDRLIMEERAGRTTTKEVAKAA